MKKSKAKPVIVETAMGKYLVRDFRQPIPLRTSPRKKKLKLKKDIKRLDEKPLPTKKNPKINKVKKRLDFHDTSIEQNSTLLIISDDNQLNDEELTNSKCT